MSDQNDRHRNALIVLHKAFWHEDTPLNPRTVSDRLRLSRLGMAWANRCIRCFLNPFHR